MQLPLAFANASQTFLTGLRAHWDAIYNASTNLGAGREVDFDVSADEVLSFAALKLIYRQEPYARRAVDLPVNDAWNRGYQILTGGAGKGQDDFYSDNWRKERLRLRLRDVVPKAARMARWGEVARIVVVSVDGADPTSPLDLRTLKRIDQFLVLTQEECRAQNAIFQTAAPQSAGASPDDNAPVVFGTPHAYQINLPQTAKDILGRVPAGWSQVLSGQGLLHHSRVINVTHGDLTVTERVGAPQREGESVIQRIFRVLAQHSSVDHAAATIATELRQHMVTIPALEAMNASNQAPAFMERMRTLAIGRTVAKMIVLGKGELFESADGSVSGFADLRDATKDALAVAHQIPDARFYGRSAQGMGGEPGVEEDVYVSLLAEQWDVLLAPVLEAIYPMIRAQKNGPYRGNGYNAPFEIVPRQLRTMKPKDEATIRLLNAQADSIYVGAGVLPAEYVAERYKGPGGYRETLPPYVAEDYPPPIKKDPAAGGSPNSEGANAPGQMPPDTTSVGTSQGSTAGTSAEGNNPGRSAAG